MTAGVDILRAEFADSCESLSRVLAGIEDDEFFWEPVAGSWTVHPRSQPRGVPADGRGEWVLDYVAGNPKPAPFTTIAWRTLHIAGVNYLYWDYAFGTASLTFDLDFPGNGATAAQWLVDSQQPLIDSLTGLADADLDAPTLTNWGEQWPAHKILTTLIKEQVHHGAEISLLRHLYRNRQTLHG